MSWMAVRTAAPSASVPNCGPSAKRTVRSVLPLSASSAPAGAKYLHSGFRDEGPGFRGPNARHPFLGAGGLPRISCAAAWGSRGVTVSAQPFLS